MKLGVICQECTDFYCSCFSSFRILPANQWMPKVKYVNKANKQKKTLTLAEKRRLWLCFMELFTELENFISKVCALLLQPCPALEIQNLCSEGAIQRTASHVSLCCFPAASFKSILNRFEGYRKPNDKFVPLSSAAVNWRSAPKSCGNVIYPGWLQAPSSRWQNTLHH